MNALGHLLDASVHWALPSFASVALVLTVLGLLSVPRWKACSVVFVVSRLAYAAFLYLVLDWRAGGDFGVWLRDHAMAVLEWRPADSPSWYGPLLPLLQGGSVAVMPGRHPIGVILPFLAGDALLFVCGPAIARRLHGHAAAEWMRWWLVALPLVWHLTVVHAQDEALFAGLLAVGILLQGTRRTITGTAVLGFGFAATKLTFAPYAAATVLAARDRLARTSAGLLMAAAVVAAALAAQAARGDDPLAFVDSGALTNRGVGVPALVQLLVPTPRVVWLTLLGVALIAAVLLCTRAMRDSDALRRIVLTTAMVHQLLMLLLPYRIASYELQGIFLMLIVLWPARGDAHGRWTLLLLIATSWLTAVSRMPEPLGSPWTVPLYITLNGMVLAMLIHEIRNAPEPVR
jgi:hypothetical protein